MSRSRTPDLLLVGPAHHGVVLYARDLAHAVESSGFAVQTRAITDAEAAVAIAATAERVHLHVTDRIFGTSPEDAADRIERMAANSQLSVTLHDIPQESDGTNFARRASAYGRILRAVRGAVVSSHYEAQLVADNLGHPAEQLGVIPIGTRVRSVPPAPAHSTSDESATLGPIEVLIAGFIYPGKGHLEAIDAVAAVCDRLRAAGEPVPDAAVVAIGSPSAGHEADVDVLRQHAANRGVELRVTGYLDDDAYRAATASAGIPIAAHRHISASRTMIDWIEQGRLPLVADSRYAREMATLRPGTVTLFQPDALADQLEHAWRHAGSTRLPQNTDLGPTLADGADAYRAWWDGLA